MTAEDAHSLRAFLAAAGALKDTHRSGRTPAGRPEDVAAHSWRLCLLVMALADETVDVARTLKMAVVHDLGEALGGDTPAPEQIADPDRVARERADLLAVTALAPKALGAEIVGLWDEYTAGDTPEARLVKAADKLETLATHNDGTQTPGFDYAFNLVYGRPATDRWPASAALRTLLDGETAAKAG